MRCLLLLLPFIITEVISGDTNSILLNEQFNNCTRGHYKTYVEAMKKADGKPDLRARKSCNYITSLENCADKLMENGSPKEEVTRLRDFHIGNIIRDLNTTVEGWDSCKCPPVKAHINRTSGEHEMLCKERKLFSFSDCTKEVNKTYHENNKKLKKEGGGQLEFCNFVTEAVQNCADKLKVLTNDKDFSIRDMKQDLDSTVKGWDSCCSMNIVWFPNPLAFESGLGERTP